MKKSLFFISILLCFCEVFAGATSNVGHKPTFVSQAEKNEYLTRAVNYPNTELEINYHVVFVSSNCRQQSAPGSAGITETVHSASHKKLSNSPELFVDVFFKQYLAHIYPSHNFW